MNSSADDVKRAVEHVIQGHRAPPSAGGGTTAPAAAAGAAELPEIQVSVDAGRASVRIIENVPQRPRPALLKQALAERLAALGTPLDAFEQLLEVSGRLVADDDPIPDVKNVVLVMSGKGGVGKSTVCANLACAMSELGARVGLLDADIYGPSVPTLFGVRSQPTGDGQKIHPIEKHGIKLMSIGFLLEDEKSAVVWRGPMLHGALMQFLKDVAWGELDYLFLDMPPGTGDIALTLAQKVQSNGAVVVTTPQEMALQDVYKAVAMNQKVGIPILGIIENQSYFVCSSCSTRHELFGRGGGERIAEQAAAPLLGQLPMIPEVQRASDAGLPVVKSQPESPAAVAFLEVAERLARRIADENEAAGGGLTIDRSGGTNRRLPIAR
jgi:ATP-binding protein involved in chromosome partitioning